MKVILSDKNDPTAWQMMQRNKRETGVGYGKQSLHLGKSAVLFLGVIALGATAGNKLLPLFMAGGQMGALAFSVLMCYGAYKLIGGAVTEAEKTDPVAKARQPKKLSGAVVVIDGKKYAELR